MVDENPQRESAREWNGVCMERENKLAFPLEKWLVKLIRAKWSLNGVGIDWQGCAAGSCTTGTSRMFDHPESYNYELNATPLVRQPARVRGLLSPVATRYFASKLRS